MQSGNDKAGIRHYLELRILLAEGISPAGGNPGEQGRHLAGLRDPAGSALLGGAHLAAPKTGGGWQGEEGKAESKITRQTCFMISLCPLSIPKGMITLLHFIESLESIGRNRSTTVFFIFF